MPEIDKLGWLSRFLALMEENPDAEITVLEDDELIVSYGPEADDEVEIGTRRKCNLINLRNHLADRDS